MCVQRREPLVNVLERRGDIEDIHADVVEGRSIVGKCTVAECGARNGGKPAVEYRKLRCQSLQDGQVIGAVLAEGKGHVMGGWHVRLLLLLVNANESIHGRRACRTRVPVVDLVINGGKVVVGSGNSCPRNSASC